MMTGSAVDGASRIRWMDAVRGVAIILLLIWHASAVPVLFGQEMPEAVRTANAFFLPYRMPILMFLSGMLLARSLRKPLSVYYSGKLAMVVWPYVVWVLIALATFLKEDQPPIWHWRAWYATSYLWFLFFIAVYYLVAPLFRRAPIWLPVLLATIAGLLLPHDTTEQRMAYFAIFFFAGNWFSQSPKLLALLGHRRTIAVTALPAIAFGVASCVWPDPLHYSVWGAPGSVLGIILLGACFSRISGDGRRLAWLTFFGRSSIVFYVSHLPAMALLSIALIDRVSPGVLAIVNLVAALALGAALAAGRRWIPVRWLFEAPSALRNTAERVLSPLDRVPRARHREVAQ